MRVKFGLFVSFVRGCGFYNTEDLISAEIKNWEISEGQHIEEGKVICVVETDKGTIEIPTPVSGVVASLNYKKGEWWQPGKSEETPFGELLLPELGIIETEETKEKEKIEEAPPAIGHENASETVKGIEEKKRGQLSGLAKKIAQEHGVTEQELINAFPDVHRIEKIQVETYLAGKKRPEPEVVSDKTSNLPCIVKAVPAARELAKKRNINLDSITGSGKDGLITYADIEKACALAVPPPTQPSTTPPFFRKAIVDNLEESWQEIPHGGDLRTIDVTALRQFRDTIKPFWQHIHTTHLTYDHFVLYFVARNLLREEYRALNAYWDKKQEKIVYLDHVNLGFAVQSPKGLVVPVVHNAELLSFAELVKQINNKVTRAHESKLTLAELIDLTFTVNRVAYYDEKRGCMVGGEEPSSIIPLTRCSLRDKRPTGMILSLGMMYQANDRWFMKAVFRFDHRLTDGTTPLGFLHDLKEFIEQSGVEGFSKILTT